MQTIYEKLARCVTEAEVCRMLRGNGMEIVPRQWIPLLPGGRDENPFGPKAPSPRPAP